VDPTTGEDSQSLRPVNIYPANTSLHTKDPDWKAPSPLSREELKQRLDVPQPGPALESPAAEQRNRLRPGMLKEVGLLQRG